MRDINTGKVQQPSATTTSGLGINAMDTYNRLMLLMKSREEEKSRKSVSTEKFSHHQNTQPSGSIIVNSTSNAVKKPKHSYHHVGS